LSSTKKPYLDQFRILSESNLTLTEKNMNATWQEIIQPAFGVSLLPDLSGGQPLVAIANPLNKLPVEFNPIIDVALAIAILVVGYIIALLAQSLTKKLLHATNLDNRLASWIFGQPAGAESPPVEKWFGSGVFWLVMIFTLVGFLDKLKLTAASQPLTLLLSQITTYIPKILGAIGLLILAWVLASLSKILVTRTLGMLRLDQRFEQEVNDPSVSTQLNLSETLANALYWFIFLLFLPAVLGALGLEPTLQPIQQMLNNILSILPNILGAVLIGFAGWLIAQIVRRLVTNLLAATGTDRVGAQFGITQTTGGQTLSSLVGTVVYVLILIPTAIAALNALKVDAISVPAVSMLTQILNTIPQIFTAVLILGVAYFIGRFIGELVTNILTGIGFNNIFQWLGVETKSAKGKVSEDPNATVIQADSQIPSRTPSEIIGVIVLVGIMLFATVTATDVLKLSALTAIINQLILICGKVLMGLIVFAIGLYFANLAFNVIASSRTYQARMIGNTARIAIIALVSAMALQQMGIATDIVNLAFGLLFGAIAVAIALAFGLGGRDVAAQMIREWLASFREKPPQG
jgi:Conserved TM helix